ncbi:hypothetical protein BHU72_07870 [Desulfuribacillus stibiiarsenatis]|uniref:NodB homology domain-containing protein n=1 Tax=Desulfuribacillus stibiiarsenatis TaxID=1390249 RepID=A0A1E5L3N4_9FIRM|nr:polysaccharide deacetylase family protein [Desulfuribacillus stibiiarsenatis]OEH84742.1 hypothetical protein BHU72_07870 [Desulfuribacillus stibiiarsenatis]
MISTKRPQTHFIICIITLLTVVFLFACQNKNLNSNNEQLDQQQQPEHLQESANLPISNSPVDSTIEETETVVSEDILRSHKVNELGQVMILMYHIIGDKEDEWERTKNNFKNDLKTLYEEGYYLVTARDFVSGNINVPLGKTPVVLTFDDGTEGHFRLIEKENGEFFVDPDCAVGIIENFAKMHPDFGSAASFYVYYPVPFRQNDRPEWRRYKYEYIINLGMEIGNHTFGHEFLNKLTDEDVQKTLVKNIQATQKLLPDYPVDTFALTYGIYPKNKELAVKGSFEGFTYHHKGVFLVGSHPAPSPYSIDFKTEAIPRIRAASVPSDFFHQWIDYFKKNPDKRFVSDGDAKTITVPESLKDQLNENNMIDKLIRTYPND